MLNFPLQKGSGANRSLLPECVVSPSASHSFDLPDAHQAISPTPSDAAAAPRVEAAELARLEQCLARVRHECAIVKLEAAPHARPKYRGPRLPPAAQLASVPGLPPVPEEQSRPLIRALAGSGRDPLPFHPAPPLATERLQPARPASRPSSRLRGALYILIASLIAGSIGYQLAGFSPTEAAHAALAVVAGTR